MKKFKCARVFLCMAALTLGLICTFTITAFAATPDNTSSDSSIIPTNGTGSVIENDNNTSSQMEFFTIKTPAGNVFYLVVDKSKSDNNVYFLTQVTEADLEKLVGSQAASTVTGGSTYSQSETGLTGAATTSQAQPTTSANKSAATNKETKSGNVGTILFVALAVLAVGGAGFYFKIYKPRHEMGSADDLDEMEQEPEDKAPETDSTDSDDADDGDGDD